MKVTDLVLKGRLVLASSALFLPVGVASADVFTNVPAAAGYQLVHSLPVPAIQGSFNTTAIPYDVDNSSNWATGSFSRVAYYLELAGSTDPTRPNGYVFVSFDRPAALANGKQLGVPSNGPNGTRVVTNTTVTNMTVISNIPGIQNGNGLAGGRLEFWPSGYAQGVNGVFDYDDNGFNGTSGHGSMQIHNAAAAQTLIGYSDWGGNTPGTPSEIGAGPNQGAGQPDWTFSDSGTTYTTRLLQVLVLPATNLVPIVNPSFETDAIAGANAPVFEVRTTAPTGWVYSGTPGQGVIAPDAGEPNAFYNGLTTGYAGSKAHFNVTQGTSGVPTVSQILTSTLQANTTYTLSLALGNRSNGDAWGGHHVALKTTSGVVVGEWTGGNTELTPDNTFGRSSRKFTTGANPPGLGQPLQIVIEQPLAAGGRYLDFDDVVLTADAAPARPVGTPVDVMIVAGQSNAQGWQGNVNALSTPNRRYVDAPSPNAFISYKQNAYGQPLYISGSMGQLSQLGAGFAGQWEGFGPELSLGTDLAGRLSNKVAVIKFASGGAGLNGQFKKTANDLYPLLVAQVNSGMAELTAQGFTPTIKGFFWLQGETDSANTGDAPLYGANITQFLSDLRTDLNAPAMKAVLTEINPNMPALQTQPTASGVVLVNQGMQTLATADPLVEYVTTADITSGFGDTIHYAADQLVSIGQRWANAYQSPPAAPAGGNVFTRVPEASAEGYQVLYELNIPLDSGYRDGVAPAYSVDNSLTAAPFDRVAYYFELTNADGTSRWVYASMDAFTTVAKQLGLPHNVLNPVKHQRLVENMNVYSNVQGLVTGTSLDGGSVEMFPSNYNMGRTGFYAGDGGNYDWDDSGATATDAGYGSFQVHHPLSQQVLFAYNHWATADGTNDDVGIGNQATGQRDYTFGATAAAYNARKLVILTRPASHVTFTAMPGNRSLQPRNLTTNLASVSIAGTEREGGYSNVVMRRYREGVFQSESVQALVYTAGAAPFSFSSQIPAELAGYDFEVLLEKNGVRRLVRRATDVVAGDALLFYGQSNTEAWIGFAANNTTSNGYASRWVRTFGQNSDSGDATRNNLSWVQANGDGGGSLYNDPGAIGQWAMVIGGKIVADHQIPVAILNGARGGYSMLQLQKDHAQPDNLDDNGAVTRTYNRLRYRATRAGVAAAARAIFYYQGESDNDNATQHGAGFLGLHSDWQTDYPGLEHIYEVQVRPGCGVTRENVALRELQRSFGDTYANTSVMTTNGYQPHDGCHYRFTGGYELLGLQHFAQVSRDLYHGPTGPNIDALNPGTIGFTDDSHTKILVTMRNAGATINFPAGALSDFALTGTSATITGYSVAGSTILFNLSAPVDSGAFLEYRSHSGGGDFVTNGSGVGLLAFSQRIGQQPPTVMLSSPVRTRPATVGESIVVNATTTPGENGAATRMVFLVNGVPLLETTGSTLATNWQVPAAGAHLLEVVAYDATGNYGRASVTIFTAVSTTPGGVTSGLVVWLKAESGITKDASGYVSAWVDQAGAADSATQPTNGNKPRYLEAHLGNGPALHFDGNDFMSGATGMPTGSYTKIVRFALDAYPPSNNLVSAGTAGDTTNRDHALFFEGTPNAKIYHSGTFLTASIATPLGKPSIVHATYDTTVNTGTLYVDNALGGSAVSGGDNTITNYTLGGYNGGNNTLSGDISEVLIYSRVLTATERNSVYTYLDQKYLAPYALWLRGHGSVADAADPGKDGVPAIIEYAHGLDPAVNNAGSPRFLRVENVGGLPELRFDKAVASSDAWVQVEMSSDLATWTEQTSEVVGSSGGFETRRVVIPGETGTAAKRFARLRVSARR
ncbi:sialate O-acetylesterase [Luteolibacter soli]|uniref:Sialate O-acetylesterase n=1 Tax=Luteolibacter soli TaxID=3135280 RepID=A0ABU9AYD3_9BACT